MDPATDSPSISSSLKTSIPAVHACSSTAPSSMNYTPPRGNTPNPRHLAIALHHARHIQARKDTEAAILSYIELLMTLPSDPDADPASPSEEDVSTFKSALVPFQPSDYDNLILERNIDGRCGYTLCPKDHRKEDPKAKFRIVWGPKGSGPGGRGKEMKVVPKEQLEKWCSDKCAERALYVRVQLSEEPAWERIDKKNMNLLLLEEGREGHQIDRKGKQPVTSMPTVEDKFRNLNIGSSIEAEQDALGCPPGRLTVNDGDSSRMLAMERGDSPTIASDKERVPVRIVEKDSTAASAPTLESGSMQGGSIEGFHPQLHPYRPRTETSYDNSLEDDDMLF
ncbi:hypothetical protein D8B26_003734 [Coccidioides posadasii str. Silveira]|uniref:RNA polymerase II subunit B1 CTD phosphatase RPAP2 homolog n=1 Tax=Coccidioides posadasii (strain RMSCC 757 / Silveira) TaxID=443226 RepID=E9DIF3_COCPS|nr:conserved hypothetical protein [Coccidioides posadasii str. Silveira]QVM09068.1 hypothetical protein D8B26_003734 [Coccidioides posadasii str. Silveira]